MFKMIEYPKRETSIVLSSQHNIMVETSPRKLREIADCLERMEERNKTCKEGQLSPLNLETALDSFHCQLHSGNISLWFRLPHPNPSLDNKTPSTGPLKQ